MSLNQSFVDRLGKKQGVSLSGSLTPCKMPPVGCWQGPDNAGHDEIESRHVCTSRKHLLTFCSWHQDDV